MTESSTVSPSTRRKVRRRRSRVVVVAAIIGVLALAGGGVALAATSGSSGDYRTATARQGDVTQVVDAVGTVAAADRYDLSFDVAGEVASVSVSVGDVVESGAVLATLDTESLQDAVDDAQSSLDDAESQLATDQEAQSSSSTSSSSTSSSSTSSGSSSSSGAASGSTPTGGGTTPSTATPTTTPTTPGDDGATDPAVEKAIAAVTTAQDALLAQYETAAAALQVSSDAVTSSGTACQPFLDAAIEESEGSDDGTTPDGTTPDGGDETADEPATDDGTTDDATEGGGTTDDGTSGAGTSAIVDALEACQSAIGTVLTNQTTVDEAQSALQERATALDEAVTALRTAVAASSSTPTSSGATSGSGSTPTESTPTESTPTESIPSGATQSETTPTEAGESGSTASTTSPTSTGSGADAAIGGSSTTVTAETLLADAAAITLAEQQLAIAQQQLADNTITAPASGTVAAVSLAAGDDVDAASTTAVITVLADSGYVVETTLPLSDVRAVAVGQTVSVTTEGDDADLAGTVSSIGVLNVSETSTPSFAVTVSFDDTEVEPLTGTAASLAITAAAASDVLVVPTSAVHVAGTTSTVDVLVDGTVESRQVDLGAVGADYTEIADGVATGDLVVLADLDQEISSDDTETQTGLTGIGGSSDTQMPGGGFPGGDLPEGFTPPDGFTPGG